MSSVYAFGWLYIDGHIVQNGVVGYSYDRPMCRLIKLDITFNYKQLSHIICAKLSIDTNLYSLKIMHRCFNPLTKMFAVAPILDDDDVELMFELVLSVGVEKPVVELYLEKVLIDKRSVDVDVVDVDVPLAALDFSTSQTSLVPQHLENVFMIRNENVQVSEDVEESGDQEKVPRGENEGEDSGVSLYRSFDDSFMVASLKEPVFTMIGDVLNVTDLRKGMVFASREELAEIVFHVHCRNHQEVKLARANSSRWNVICKRRDTGCIWSLKATKRKRHGFFEIMKIWGTHTCVNPNITEGHADLMICPSTEEVPNTQVDVDPCL